MTFPDVLSKLQTDDATMVELDIDPRLQAFEGHFDSFPIVPGVIQIQWALHFFQQIFHSESSAIVWRINKVTALKFQHVIAPHSKVNLHLSFDEAKCCLTFKFSNEEHTYSSGKLFLEKG